MLGTDDFLQYFSAALAVGAVIAIFASVSKVRR